MTLSIAADDANPLGIPRIPRRSVASGDFLSRTGRGDGMQVRVLTDADEAEYRALRLAATEASPASASPETVRELAFFVRAETGVFAHHAREGTCVWGVHRAEELIGVIAATRGFGRRHPHAMHLWGLYVRSDSRGSRLGSQLLQAVLAWVGQQAFVTKVVLYVHRADHRALMLFQRAGFALVEDDGFGQSRLCAMHWSPGAGSGAGDARLATPPGAVPVAAMHDG